MKHRPDKAGVAVGAIFLLIGIGMLVGTYFLAKDSLNYSSNGVSAKGVVAEVVRRSSDDGYTYYPLVKFYAGSEEIEFMHSIGSSDPAFSVNEEVDVLYMEGNPQDAKIDAFFSLWGVVLVVGVFGTVFSLVGGFVGLSGFFERKNHEKLMASGQKIYAKFECVDFFEREKGSDYWTIKASWHNPRDNKMYIFHSRAFW